MGNRASVLRTPPGKGIHPCPAGAFYFMVEIFAEIGYTIL